MYIIRTARIKSTWETLAKAAEEKKLDKILRSGDLIPITLKNGEKHQIAATQDGTGEWFFVFTDCLAERHVMNEEYTNAGGWEKSAMREWLNESVIKLMPDEIRGVIRSTRIVQVTGGKRITTKDELWLPSETQVFGTAIFSYGENDHQLEFYKSLKNRIKICNGSASNWWLRSPYSGSSNIFCGVNSSGSADNYGATGSYGVSPGFVI